jgi:hypothetical protein
MVRHWRRWLVLLLLPLAIVAGIRYFFSSHFLANRVTAQLEKLYGGTVHVGRVEVGTQQTILFDVEFFEPGEINKPWLTIERLEAELSIKKAIHGATPSRIAMHGVTVTLRFDLEGRLLTDLPPRPGNSGPILGELPEIVVTTGKLMLVGPRNRQLVFDDIALTLKPLLQRYCLEGQANESASGTWNASGWIDTEKSQASLTARSKGEVAVTQPMLEALPFVSLATWQDIKASGPTTVAATLSYDWATPRRNYCVELHPHDAWVQVPAIDLTATEVTGNIEIADGRVKLRDLQGRASDGMLGLDGDLDFSQPGFAIDLAKLAIDGADIRQLSPSWGLPSQLEGRLHCDCQLHFIGGACKLRTTGTGGGSVADAHIAGFHTNGPILLKLQEVNGATNLGVDIQLWPTELSAVADAFGSKLTPEISGQLVVGVQMLLPLDTINDPITYTAQGHMDVTEARMANLAFEPVKAALHYAKGELKMDECRVTLQAGGSCTASVAVNLKEPYTFQSRLEPAGIDLAVLHKIDSLLHVPLPLTGRLDATVDLQGALRPFTLTTAGAAHGIHLRAGNTTIDTADFHWRSDANRVVFDPLQAEAYGGYIHGTADFPLKTGGGGAGQLWLEGLDLSRLAAMRADPAGFPAPVGGMVGIGGNVDADLAFVLEGPDFFPTAKGRVIVNDLAWKDDPLAADVRADVVLTHQELTIGNIAATLAQGNVSGKIALNLIQPERSWFQIDMGNAELSDLLHSWPSVAEQAKGSVELRLRGTLGKEWAGTADAVLERGKILGLDVGDWRAPIRWTFVPSEGRGELEVRDSHAQLAQGRATAQATAIWNSGLRLTSQIQFVGINLHQAFPGSKLGNGRATGRIDVSSERLQTVDDLQANLMATVQHTQALDYPVLRQVAPFLGITTTKTFQNGEVRARLARGVVHFEKLAFAEGPWQLYAEGNVTLQGNVHLDMTANSGRLGNLAAALGWRVPQTGIIGGDLLTRATTALSPQLVHVHVRGTVREPAVQVVPLPLLTEQALRFFAGGT